jgi:hypothetical protein
VSGALQSVFAELPQAVPSALAVYVHALLTHVSVVQALLSLHSALVMHAKQESRFSSQGPAEQGGTPD